MKPWLFLQAITFEFLSLYLLLDTSKTELNWFLFLIAHATACISFTYVTWLMLPSHYQSPSFATAALIFTLAFSLPLYGMLGIIISVLIALYNPQKQNQVTWKQCEEAPLPQHPNVFTHIQYGTGALREILMNHTEPERRLLAVKAVGHLPNQQAIPLLQLALKDLSDDVRLLAYASLENIETQINELIATLEKQFNNKEQASKAFEIAQQYWELCYLGLAEGTLRLHYLEQSRFYLEKSNSIIPSASNYLLLGRVQLEQGEYQDALNNLKQALNGNLLKTQVIPYLAEAAYCMENYKLARQYIQQFPDKSNDTLGQIKEYWQ